MTNDKPVSSSIVTAILRRRFDVILLSLFAASLYLNSLPGEFIWDDKQLVGGFSNLKAALTREFLTRTFYRPVPALSFYVDLRNFGQSPSGFHITNVILNTGVVLLVYFFFLTFLKKRWQALLAAAAFAALPAHVEAVSWISGRTDLFCALFFLGAFLSHIRYRETGSRQWLGTVAFLFLLALMSKEMAAVFPVTVIIYEWVQGTLRKQSIRSWITGYVIAFLIYLAARMAVLKPWQPPTALQDQPVFEAASTLQRLLGLPYNILKYAWIALIPHDPVPFYSAATLQSLSSWIVAVSFLAVLMAAAFALYLKRHSPAASFGLLFFGLTILPACNIVQLPGTTMAERFTYLPSVGLVLTASVLLKAAVDWRPQIRLFTGIVVSTLVAGFIAVAGFMTITGNLTWRSEYSLWSKTVAVRPDQAFAHNNLGKAYEDRGLLDMAEERYRKAIKLQPDYAVAHANLGSVLRENGRLDEAVKELKMAVKLEPRFYSAYSNLGATLGMMGRYDEAAEALKKALEILPDYQSARLNLALVYEANKQYSKAAKEYEELLKRQPELLEHAVSLGRCYRLSGRTGDALRLLTKLANQTQNVDVQIEASRELDLVRP